MRTEIAREIRFESAHRLPNVAPDHKCARLHGHSFRVTIVVTGEVDTTLGWVIDFADLDRAFAPLRERLDHRYLNEIEGLENPTSEHLARWIAERLVVPSPATLVRIVVHETCTSSCTYFP